jgi:hypothetical protein
VHIAVAPFTLKPGVTEKTMLTASDGFEARFVKAQQGIIWRVLVKDAHADGYADIVLFEDLDTFNRVLEAEQQSEACASFFAIMDGDDQHRVYEVVRGYQNRVADPPTARQSDAAATRT